MSMTLMHRDGYWLWTKVWRGRMEIGPTEFKNSGKNTTPIQSKHVLFEVASQNWHTQFQFRSVFFSPSFCFSVFGLLASCQAADQFQSTLCRETEYAETISMNLYISISTNNQKKEALNRQEPEEKKNVYKQRNQNSQLISVVSRDTYSITHRHNAWEWDIRFFPSRYHNFHSHVCDDCLANSNL